MTVALPLYGKHTLIHHLVKCSLAIIISGGVGICANDMFEGMTVVRFINNTAAGVKTILT